MSSSASTTKPWMRPHESAGYERLRRLLHVWSLTVTATSRPGYYEELAVIQNRYRIDSPDQRSRSGLGGASGGHQTRP